jgi:hypothetical protein
METLYKDGKGYVVTQTDPSLEAGAVSWKFVKSSVEGLWHVLHDGGHIPSEDMEKGCYLGMMDTS